ncbi:trimeric intracellular cation channel family protein [Alginatibacterium sediminis]|uniref:Trimeric intracellular cation channel family protein n=1 Tax=Alginatibacterium sediminis TaxID=2164068 RepID=A0A420ECV0_9ALTE|nr:trimeric intracellular cation channel family protein [Alginatibacterium sediminis]RKF18493.1 trimeric intracellular cation channel family protein [Alginatibacterium sediminis]
MSAATFDAIIYNFGLFAVFVFALTGAVCAAKKELDIFAFILAGVVTGIGGGTLRDVLLNIDQVFWIEDPAYLSICIFASVITYYAAHWVVHLDKFLLWLDAAGIALFAVLGTQKAMLFGAPPLVAVVMGVMTSTIGSVLRDIIMQQRLVIFDPEIYVTACLAGSTSYLALIYLEVEPLTATLIASSLAFALRGFALALDIRFPSYQLSKLQSRELKKQQDSQEP